MIPSERSVLAPLICRPGVQLSAGVPRSHQSWMALKAKATHIGRTIADNTDPDPDPRPSKSHVSSLLLSLSPCTADAAAETAAKPCRSTDSTCHPIQRRISPARPARYSRADNTGSRIPKTTIHRQNANPVQRKGTQDPHTDNAGAGGGAARDGRGGDADVQGCWENVRCFPT